jgi:hypothetical protein
MRSGPGLLFRLILALSLAALPWTQAWSMAWQGADQPPPCHAPSTPSAPDQNATGCCLMADCHCIAAIALPSVPHIGSIPAVAAWEAWTPRQPPQPDFAPTPPPPRV